MTSFDSKISLHIFMYPKAFRLSIQLHMFDDLCPLKITGDPLLGTRRKIFTSYSIIYQIYAKSILTKTENGQNEGGFEVAGME